MSDAPAVAWFRRDLRLADNPMLVEAGTDGRPVVGLFVVDPLLVRTAGEHRRGFLAGCLAELDAALDGRLVVRHGDPVEVVAAVAAEAGAAVVHATDDFGPYGRRRDLAVAERLGAAGAELRRTGSPYAVAPGTLAGATGRPFRVFSAYHRAWTAAGWPRPLGPAEVEWVDGVRREPPDLGGTTTPAFPPGEHAAHERLAAFLGEVERYGEQRDRADADGTSRLSPHLKFGCIHPRQVLDALGDHPGAAAFARQLCWRDFYADVLFHQPATVRRSLQPTMDRLAVDEGPVADARFAAWAEGRTGYPLVDAGMRQLAAEGWLPNRVRMVVASFLVKDLHLPWWRGAAELGRRLVDGDVASNTHGWQWVAGTGTDPAPFHRVFNPTLQARRFDPDGAYVRRWVPELAGLTAPQVHEPWTRPGGPPAGYPGPIVDHAAERIEALARMAALRA